MKTTWFYRSTLIIVLLIWVLTASVAGIVRPAEASAPAEPGLPVGPKTIFLPFVALSKPALPAPVIPSGLPTSNWPSQVIDVTYASSLDGSTQHTLFYTPGKTATPVPLLVGLHTWSTTYAKGFTQNAPYAQWAIANGWVFISPNFEGSNDPGSPNTTGSNKAVQDVVDAVNYAKSRTDTNIDPHRIYLIGVSGGGHMALLVAGRHPEIWAGVSAWASITNLVDWHSESMSLVPKYAYDIERACGNINNHTIDEASCLLRSSVHYLNSPANFNNQNMPVDINAGIYDGHTISGDTYAAEQMQKLLEAGISMEQIVDSTIYSVPISQALNQFNLIALPTDVISSADITTMTKNMQVPTALAYDKVEPFDDLYTNASLQGGSGPAKDHRPILFRAESGNARVTVFKGYHEIVYWPALSWLSQQWKP